MSSTISDTRSPIIASWVLLIGTCVLAIVPIIGFLAWIIGGVFVLIAIVLGIVVISKGGTWHGIFILMAALVVVPVIIFFGPIVSSLIAGAVLDHADDDSPAAIEDAAEETASDDDDDAAANSAGRDEQKKVAPVASSSPQDAGAKVEGLTMLARRQQTYVVEFVGRPDRDTFQITRHASAKYRRDTFLVGVDQVTTDGKLKIEAFEPAEKTTDTGIVVDVSKLTATYVDTGEAVELVRGERLSIPTFFVEVKYASGQLEKPYYKIGEKIVLPDAPTRSYEVIDIEEESTTLRYVDEAGNAVTIEITKAP